MVFDVCKTIGCSTPLTTQDLQIKYPRKTQWQFCLPCKRTNRSLTWPCLECETPIEGVWLTKLRCKNCVSHKTILDGRTRSSKYYWERHEPFHVLRNTQRKDLYDFIVKSKDATYTEISEHFKKWNHGTAVWHLKTLRKHGAISLDWRTRLYRPT